jgi:hypothetical protein
VQIDSWNRRAVRTLLADAGRTLALPQVENDRGNRENVVDKIANARKTYLDLVRRSGPLIMSADDQVAFQEALDQLTDFLKCH